MVNPTPGQIIKAKEGSPTAYDDILGAFRQSLVRKVESTIQYHRDNVADAGRTFYRVGINDSVANPNLPGFGSPINIDGLAYFFQKSGAPLAISDVFGPPTTILPDDGQVPQNAGDRIDGQRSFWDTNGGTGVGGPGTASASITTSVANAIAEHTKLLCRVRRAAITERMATTSKKWNSKTYPATFEGVTVPAKGDNLSTFTQLYQFASQGTKDGIASFNDPLTSANLDFIVGQTMVLDRLRGKVVDAGGNSIDGPQETGEYITSANLRTVFDVMNNIWEQSKDRPARVVIDYCHTSCHASCHSSRSRR